VYKRPLAGHGKSVFNKGLRVLRAGEVPIARRTGRAAMNKILAGKEKAQGPAERVW